MGLVSRRKASCSPLVIHRVIILVAAFILIALFLLSEMNNLISQTKTITGHNLEPTPWHIFPQKLEESKYSRASKIIQCSYLSCRRPTPAYFQLRNYSQKKPSSTKSCPKFFQYIHRDLEPWANTKISRNHVKEAQKFASFRVVIINGILYVDFYYACVESRAMFTIWGLLQLLRRYPGKVPDVDFMFDCMDKPSIKRTEHASMPLPLFRYCTTPEHFDIPFPDWSFWGWSETNIRPWDKEFESIKRGSQSLSWPKRFPFAYWKGNPDVSSPIRMDLLQCNNTKKWGAHILRQDWSAERRKGFKGSALSKQCKHRYKIYAEGYAWSVSLKYILSCGSVPLIIKPKYEDFYSRGLIPKINYWPVPDYELCQHIKDTVDWGNSHPSQAEAIGRRAQDFMGSLRMDRVYDYMFHLITKYAKLQDFTPIQPPSAQLMCIDSVLCFADDKQKQFLKRSVSFPSLISPCALQPRRKYHKEID